MKKCIILGNCQTTHIKKILSESIFSEVYEICTTVPIQIMTQKHLDLLEPDIKNCDLLITQLIAEKYNGINGIGTKNITKQLKNNAQKIIIPSLYANIYNPEIFYLKNEYGKKVSEGFDYHHKLIFYGFLKGYSVETTKNLFFLPIANIENIICAAFEEIFKRDSYSDVKVFNFIKTNYNKSKLFYTFNHPNNKMLFFIVNSILRILKIDEININNKKEALDGIYFPILKNVYHKLNLEFDENFDEFNFKEKKYSINDMICLYFDFYTSHKDLVCLNSQNFTLNIDDVEGVFL